MTPLVPMTAGPGAVPGFTPEVQVGGFTTAQTLGQGALAGSLISIAATPNAAAVGDFVVVSFCWALASVALSTVTDTSGNTWTVVSAPAPGSESGGYGYTTVTTGWASGANTVTGTLASGAPGGRCWAAVGIPAAYSPVIDQHNEVQQATNHPTFTLSSSLAQAVEEIIIVDIVRTSPQGSPQWQWVAPFSDRCHINGSGTPGSGTAIGSMINEVGTAAVTGAFQGLNSGDNHGGGILAVKVTLPAPPGGNTDIDPPVTTATASAPIPTGSVATTPPAGAASASAPLPTGSVGTTPPAATASASAPLPAPSVSVAAPAATASASAPLPAPKVSTAAPIATATASAPIPTITVAIVPPVTTATGSAPLPAGMDVGTIAPSATAAASSLVPVVSGLTATTVTSNLPVANGGTVWTEMTAGIKSAHRPYGWKVKRGW